MALLASLLFVLVIVVVALVAASVKLVPQAQAAVIERLGRYQRTVSGQLTLIIPFIDRVRAKVDLRERVVAFPPQSMITEDNLTLHIDTVVYFQVTDPRAAVYEINDYIVAVEQLATTTLRNVVGGLTLEQTLTSRDMINRQLRGVLDTETGRWGLRVARVELRSIDPPPSIQESMEKQMKADREKRAIILTAEGQREAAIKTAEGAKQAAILDAEGSKQAAILGAEAERQSRMLRAQGERAARYLVAEGQAAAVAKVNSAVKASRPTPEMLAYQYVQNLPEMAKGDAATMWMIPSQLGDSLEGFVKAMAHKDDDGVFRYQPSAEETEEPAAAQPPESWFDTTTDPHIARSVAAAEAAARVPVDGEVAEVPPPDPAVFDHVPGGGAGSSSPDSAPSGPVSSGATSSGSAPSGPGGRRPQLDGGRSSYPGPGAPSGQGRAYAPGPGAGDPRGEHQPWRGEQSWQGERPRQGEQPWNGEAGPPDTGRHGR